MPTAFKTGALNALIIAVAAVPWLAAMYAFHWLDSSGTWTSDTPHRGKLSVAILATGMVVSFLVYSYLRRYGRK